jgi:hypothetical protein
MHVMVMHSRTHSSRSLYVLMVLLLVTESRVGARVRSTVVGKMVPIFLNMSQRHKIIHDGFKSSIPIS